jgi:SNF2 family DNA or RNA helicase
MTAMLMVRDGNLCVLGGFDEKEKIKSAGASWNKDKKFWYMPFTIANYELLLDRLVNPQIETSIQEYIAEQKRKESKLLAIARMSKRDQPITFKVPGIRLALFNYQKYGVMYALENDDGFLLADSMGLGKSVQAIGMACCRKYNSGAHSCLVIVPASLKWNWPLEIEKFTNEPYVVIDGAPEDRIAQWAGRVYTHSAGHGKFEYHPVKSGNEPFFYVANYEMLLEDLFGGREMTIKDNDTAETKARKLKISGKAAVRAQKLAPVRQKIWDMIAIDEAQAIRSHHAKKTQNVKALKGKFRVALTGTPLDGKLEELHSVMEFVKPGLFMPKTRFLQHHAEFDYFGKIKKYKKIGEVKDKLAPYFLRRLKEDVMKDLPEKTYQNILVTLSAEEKKIYDALADREHPLTEESEAMVKVIRCKQFCDHPELVGETCKASKMEAFLEIVDELVCQNAQKIIVFSQYKTMLDIVERELKKMKIRMLRIDGDTPKMARASYQKDFNEDPHIDAIIGTEAMSAGLNLIGATYCIMLDDNWAPAIMRQREDRCHRYGQKNAVTIVNFICQDTIEERIRDVLVGKETVSSDVLGDEISEIVLKRLNPKEIQNLL